MKLTQILAAATPIMALTMVVASIPAHAQNAGSRAASDERILNGAAIDGVIRKAEWTMSLRRNGAHYCGASFISPRMSGGKVVRWSNSGTEPKWAVTAAHCLFDQKGDPLQPSELTVYGGVLNIESGPSNNQGEIQQVRAYFIPDGTDGAPTYNHGTNEHDIALLRLADSEKDIPTARGSIRLPNIYESTWVYETYTAWHTAGWGRTSEGGVSSPNLLEVLVPAVDPDDCVEKFAPYGDEIGGGVVCAGFVSGQYDACQGDSGGPLYYRPTTLSPRGSEELLVGVVSWGRGCGGADLFGVYTSIVYYEGWIKEIIQNN